MKMSSTLSMRVKVLVLSGLFALASSCSGDKAPADEELDVSGEEAAAAPAEGEAAAAPAEGEPAADTKKAKKGKKGSKKG
jgi:hypothetical protein